MFVLIYTVATIAANIGTYPTMANCQKAAKDHARSQILAPDMPTHPELEKALDIMLKTTNKYVCVKVDKKS